MQRSALPPTVASLTLAGYTGTILGWESSTDNGSTWNNIANTTNSLSYTNLNTTTLYRALVQSGSCASLYSNNATITVVQAVTAANAGVDQQLCDLTSATMAANTPAVGTGSWTAIAGNPSVVTFVNAANPTTTVNGLTTGTYQFVWTVTNGVCTGSKDTVQVIVYPPTVAGTLSADATVCATSNSGTLTLSGYVSNILQWESSTDNGTTWNNIADTTASQNYNNLAASTKYRASVQNAICPALYSNIVSITVLQAVTASPMRERGPVSSAMLASATMAGNTPASGTGTWTAVAGNPGAATFTNAASATTTVNGLIAGTYQFIWTISNGVCTDSKDTVQLIIYPATVPGTVTANATVCATANSGTLTLAGYTGTILRWEFSTDNGTTWSNIANTTTSLSYTNLIATTLYRALVQSGSCTSLYSNNATITVVQAVTAADAGVDQQLCNLSSTTMAANTPAVGTGSWTAIAGNPSVVTFINPANPATTVNGLISGTYQFVWTVTNGVCTGSKDTVQVIVYPPTTAGTLSADATVCATSNSGTLNLSGYVSNILQWESSTDNGTTWNNIANTTASQNYNNLAASTKYRASVQNAICPALYSNIVNITVLQAVTIANAGADQLLCNVSAATMAGNIPTSGTGTWTAVAGNPSAATFTNAASATTTVNGLTAGTYQFVWTISNGVCTDSKDTVQVIIYPATVPGTVATNATVCATANSGTLTLAGYTGTILRWEFSTDNGTTWSNIVNTTTTLSYNNLNATTLYRALVQSGSCTPLYSNNATITVLQPVTAANAGVDQQLCNLTATTMAGNTLAVGTGTWTSLAGNPSAVIFTSATNPATTVNGLINGTYQFVWTVSNGVCTDSKDTVQVIVYPPTTAGTLSADATVCATSNSGTLNLSGYASNILRWESSTDNGTTWNNIANTTASQNYTNLAATTVYRTLVQSGNCTSLYSNNVTVTVLQAVAAANAGIDQSHCNVGSTTMAGNIPTSGTGTWTAAAGNPSAVSFTNAASASTTVNGLTAGTYQFIWTISNGTCASSKDTVQVTVYPATTPGTLAADATVCATSNSGTLNLSGYATDILRWESSTDNGTTWNNIANTTSALSYNNVATLTKYRAYVQNAICPALYSNVINITVLQPVTIANAGPDTTIINGISSYKLGANTPTSGTGTWTVLPGGPSTLSFINVNNPTTTVGGLTYITGTPPSNGTYKLVWTISNGYCASSSDTMTITTEPPTNPGRIGPDTVVCVSNNHGTLTLSDFFGEILQWESSIDYGTTWSVIAGTVGQNDTTYTYDNLSTTTLFRALVQNGVGLPLYSGIAATVTVLQLVTPSDAGPDQNVCNSTSTVLAGNSPTSGSGTWSAVAGNPTTVTFSNVADPASVISGLGYGTYQFVWTIANGICSDSRDTVRITVQQPTIAGTIAADATVCATANSGTLNISGYRGSVVEGQVSTDNGATWLPVANTANLTSFTYTNLPITSQFRAQVQNGVCPALVTNIVTITVLSPATIANAGPDQSLCSVTAATLAGNTPTSGTGTWTAVAGNPSATTFTDAADPATTVNGLTTGTYRFVWTISNVLCADSKDTVTVTVYAVTLPGTLATDATVCATGNSGRLNLLTGYRSSILRWETSIDNGTSWNNVANTTDSLLYSNLNATIAYRAYVQNVVCPALYSNIVTITVVQPVTIAAAGPDQSLCNVSGTTLAANNPASGTGLWTAVAGNPSTATFTNAADRATTVNGLTTGTYQFVWTISNALCADSRDTVSVIVYAATLPGTVALDATVCATGNNGRLNLTGYRSSILRWESSTDNGTSWNNVANTTDSLLYNNLNATIAYRAYVQNAVCPAQYSNTVTITVMQAVTIAAAGSDQSLCNTTTTVLAGNTPTSGTGTWTAVAGNPSATTFTNAADPATTVNGLTTGTYRFVWTISNALCADSRDTVSVTVYAATLPGTLATDATVCATGNAGRLNLTGYRSSILRWETSIDNGTSWSNVVNTTDSLLYNNLSGTTAYRAYVQNVVCPALYSNIVTITVVQPVTIAAAGPDQSLCNVSGTTLAANNPASGTGLWTAVAGNPSTATFTNAADRATTVNGLTTGTYQFVWTISNALCADSRDTVSVTVYAATLPGTVALDATVCATGNNGRLNLTGYRSSILRWESSTDNGTSWNNVANTTDSLLYNNLNATIAYRAYVQNAVCPAQYSNTVTITVMQAVTIAAAGSDQSLCNTTTTVLAGNTPTSGTGTWTAVAGNPSATTFTNAADPATTVNGLTTGTYRFVWTISNALCADSRDTVSVTVYAATLPGTLATDATVCATGNAGRLNLTGYRSSILRWETSIDNGTSWSNVVNTTDSLLYNNLSGTTAYRAYVQNVVCPALYSNIVTITVVQPVTIAAAGPDQSLCNVSGTTLAANNPASGTGLWTAVAGNPSTATFTNAADRATTVNGLTTGTYQFVWTISNALCADSRDTVSVTVYAATLPGTVALDATVCATGNNGRLNLTGYRSSILRWESSTDNGTSWNNVANTTDSLLYNNLNATIAYRAYVQNAVCPAQYSNTVTITVMQAVTIAAAGSDQSLCNTTTTVLAGNTPTSGTGTWTAVAGNPSATTFTNAADPATTVNGLTTGTYRFVWTISNALCADSRDTVSVTVYAATLPGTLATDATVCATGNAGRLNLTGYRSSILRWETSIDNGSSWNNVVNTTDSLLYNNLGGTTAYRAYVQNVVCPALYSNIVTITVVQPVTIAAAGPDQSLCNVSGTTLAANNPASGTGLWTAVAGNPSTATFTNAADRATTVNGLAAGTYQFVWTISNALCADSRDTVSVTVYAATLPGTVALDATVCATGNNGRLNLTGYRSSILRWESSTDNGTSWNNVTNTTDSLLYNNLNATIAYRAYVQNAVCPAQYSNTVTITVMQAVTIAAAGPDQSLCNTTTTVLAGNTPTSGTGTWTAVAGNPSATTFTNAADPATTVNGLTTGTYRFVWTISNALCADSRDTVSVTVYAATLPGTLATDATVCATGNAGRLNLTGYRSSILRWETSADNGTSWSNVVNTTDSLLYNNLSGTIAYRAYVQNVVCPALYSNIVTITVVQPVTIAAAGPDQSLCNVSGTTLAANNPASGTGLWTAVAGNPSTATFTNAADRATTVNGLTTGTYQFVWTISNALCADSRDTVSVTVYAATLPGTVALDATVCATGNNGRLNLTAYRSSILRWESSADNGTSWNNVANTTDSLLYNNLNATIAYRAYVQNAVCPALYSNTVTITVMQAVTIAAAGSDQSLCNTTTTVLAGNTPTSGTGTWTAVAGNPSATTFTNAADPATTVNGLTTGTYRFVWTISNALCADSRDTVSVTVYAATNAGTLVADAFVCAVSNSGTLRLSGFTGNILAWESSNDSGTTWHAIAGNSDSLAYSNLLSTTQFRALIQNGSCNSLYSNIVTITVNPATIPGKLSAANNTVCAAYNSGSLLLAGFTGSIVRWEFSEDNGNTWSAINQSAANYGYTGLTKATWFRVAVQSGVCSTGFSDTVRISVDANTVAGTLAGSATVCAGSNSGTLALTGTRGKVLHWESSVDNGTNWAVIADTAMQLTYKNIITTTQYRALVQNGVCAVQYSNAISVTATQPVTVAVAGNDIVLCNGDAAVTLNGNQPTSGTGIWTLVKGSNAVNFSDPALPVTKVSGLTPGSYQFAWTISNGVCAASNSPVNVTVDKINPSFSLAGQNECGQTVFSFKDSSVSHFGIRNVRWSVVAGDTATGGNYTHVFTREGKYNIAHLALSNSGCVANSAPISRSAFTNSRMSISMQSAKPAKNNYFY
jgi:hypothetical protein